MANDSKITLGHLRNAMAKNKDYIDIHTKDSTVVTGNDNGWEDRVTNATTTFVVPTYEGSGQTIHPSMLYFKDGWNGYNFWLGITPYPNSNDATENPSVFASNDGINWVVPYETPNPLDQTTDVSVYYLSDTQLVYRKDLDRLEIWYRKHLSTPDLIQEVIYRRTTTDGSTWTEVEELYSISGGNGGVLLSPTAIYEDGIYKIWVTGYNDICYFTSIDGKNWNLVKKGVLPRSTAGFHIAVTRTNNGYVMLGHLQGVSPSDRTSQGIVYTFSEDGINWGESKKIFTVSDDENAFDYNQLYRPHLTVGDNKYYLLYSGRNKNNEWHTGILEIPLSTTTTAQMKHNATEIQETDERMFISKATLNSILNRLTLLENSSSGSIVHVSGINLDKSASSLTVGKTVQLTATLTPSNATNTTVEWTASNENATVSSTGLVTAVATGACTITATSQDGGYTATCEVTIVEATGTTGLVEDGLIYNLDALDYTSGNATWTASVGNEVITFANPAAATKNGNLIDLGKDKSTYSELPQGRGTSIINSTNEPYTTQFYIDSIKYLENKTWMHFITGPYEIGCGNNAQQNCIYNKNQSGSHVYFATTSSPNYPNTITVTYDGTNIKTYLGTTLLDTKEVTSFTPNADVFQIGSKASGSIGCIRRYNRVLSEAEIEQNVQRDIQTYQ